MKGRPAALGGGGLVVWRLDQQIRAATWDSGERAFREGGRWNSKGVHAVYCSLDPATATLEVAVHKGFRALDTVAHLIPAARIADIAEVHVVQRGDAPSALAQWFVARTAGAKGRMKKIIAVALARKLLVNLWRYIETRRHSRGRASGRGVTGKGTRSDEKRRETKNQATERC